MKPPTPELEALVSAYVSGSLTSGEMEELTRLLREAPEARDYFLFCLDLHAELTVDDSLAAAVSDASGKKSAEALIPSSPQDSGSARQPERDRMGDWLRVKARSKRTIGALAACALAAVTLGIILFNQGKDDHSGPTVYTDSAGLVAVMTDADNTVWKTGSFVPRDVGEAIGRRPVELLSGRAEFQFDSGARVAIGGPAKLEFLSANRARLHRGRLTAYVPEQARGFTVDFDGAKVVDQGTEFALNCDGHSKAELHVFDGEVLVLPEKSQESSPLRLAANDTKTLRTRRGVVEDALFESDRFLRIHRDATIPETSGSVRYLHRAPRTVLQGAFEHNAYILLFRERSDLVLTESVQVNAITPGEYRTKRKPEDPPGTAIAVRVDQPAKRSLRPVEPGTRVSSYFVHFDPVRSGGPKGVHRRGSIRFSRPVLGVIIATRDLVPTDGVLGHSGTRYETTDFAIARNGLEPDDRMTLSEDRRTVHLKLGAGTSVDHVRILVAAR